ncbi:MAG TPA: saccharopine dehydrogenase NADP-binding domain-containing protein [Kofleriaceae bacterium]|jgi:short subunit dehydrogenase-like uncharacterized protein
MSDREYDLVLFGATGFTGRLVAEYLAASPEKLRWAIAGRNREKLAALGLSVPIEIADAMDAASVGALAARTKVVCTTVGPYAKYGSALVAACAKHGTHYCDLTGEVQWMRQMIDAHDAEARETGARIVHTCGFDSIPSDLGAWAAQQAFHERFGGFAQNVTALYGEQSGGLSGGTFASALETARVAADDKHVRRLLANPYGLDPDPKASRPPSPDDMGIGWEPRAKVFTIPFVMAAVNTRVVRRAHALAGQPWGPDFVYREVMSTPASAKGALMAVGITGGLAAFLVATGKPRLREWIAKKVPQPGTGPSAKTRERGHWKVRFLAARGSDLLRFEASDRADPGYGSTAKMLGESALCLALDRLDSPGGVTTPTVAMAAPLLARLRRAGLTFTISS